MFYKIAIVLAILWLLGLVTSYTMGGVIHVLLAVAIIMVLANFNYATQASEMNNAA